MTENSTKLNYTDHHITKVLRPMPWGKKANVSIIGRLGEKTNSNERYGELWLGAHNTLSSELIIDNKVVSLYELIQQKPNEILGEDNAKNFGSSLPFLLKILSVDVPLSIQLHPSPELALALHQKDPGNYPNSNHKPEIAYALTKVDLLYGLRSVTEIIKDLSALPEIPDFLDFTSKQLKAIKSEQLQTITKKIYSLPQDLLSEYLMKLNKYLQNKSESKTLHEKLFTDLYTNYPSDPGMIFLFMMNYISLNPGEAVYTPTSVPHAYLSGEMIECMTNSDNTIRGGLTNKYIDISSFLEALNYQETPLAKIPYKPSTTYNNAQSYNPSKEFSLKIFKEGNHRVSNIYGPQILLSIEGLGEMTYNDRKFIKLGHNTSLFLQREIKEFNLRVDKGIIVIASISDG